MPDHVAQLKREVGEGVKGAQGAGGCGKLHDWVTRERMWRRDFDGDELVSS